MCCDNISPLIYLLPRPTLGVWLDDPSVCPCVPQLSLRRLLVSFGKKISLWRQPLLPTHHLPPPRLPTFLWMIKSYGFLFLGARIIIFPKQGFNCVVKVFFGVFPCSWTKLLRQTPNQTGRRLSLSLSFLLCLSFSLANFSLHYPNVTSLSLPSSFQKM